MWLWELQVENDVTTKGAHSMINAARNLLTKHPRAEWLIPAALCLILLAQMLCSVRQMSQHADEAFHLYAGYRALKCGDYTLSREHPPLLKMLVAIPLMWSDPPINCAEDPVASVARFAKNWALSEEDQGTSWLYSQENWWHLLMEARTVSSLFAVALCLGVWIAARRMFGRTVAVVSAVALAFEPNVLAHGPLLLNNILLSALFLLTAAWALNNKTWRLVSAGTDPTTILPPAGEAVELAPASLRSRDYYCLALAINGYAQQALSECSVALRLAKADPLSQGAVQGITNRMEYISQVSGAPLPPGMQ